MSRTKQENKIRNGIILIILCGLILGSLWTMLLKREKAEFHFGDQSLNVEMEYVWRHVQEPGSNRATLLHLSIPAEVISVSGRDTVSLLIRDQKSTTPYEREIRVRFPTYSPAEIISVNQTYKDSFGFSHQASHEIPGLVSVGFAPPKAKNFLHLAYEHGNQISLFILCHRESCDLRRIIGGIEVELSIPRQDLMQWQKIVRSVEEFIHDRQKGR